MSQGDDRNQDDGTLPPDEGAGAAAAEVDGTTVSRTVRLGHGGEGARAETIGSYRLLRELGRGGQGTVYLATDERLGRQVALKVLRLSPTLHGSGPLERFRREAEAAAKLDDPGICAVYEMGFEDHLAWIAMRHVEGETLASRIRAAREAETPTFVECLDDAAEDEGEGADSTASSRRSRPERRQLAPLLRLFEKAARSLHVAHEAGVIHRDIKPANIMVSPDHTPVILDFGLARDEELDAATLTDTGQVLGTPAYMSPEQLLARRVPLDHRTDVYSLGVALYECATLERPFDGPTREALYQQIATKEPVDPRRLNPAIPRDLATVILTATAKDADRRYATAAAFADDLAALCEGRPVSARPVGPLGRLVRWGRREPALAGLLLVLVVASPVIAMLTTSYLKDRPLVEAQRLADLRELKDDHLSEGFLALGEGRTTRAVESFAAATALEGGSPEGAAGLAMAELARGRPDAALEALDRHRALLVGRRAEAVLRAQALREMGRVAASGELPPARDEIDHYLLGTRVLGTRVYPALVDAREALGHLRQAILLSTKPRALFFQQAARAAAGARETEEASQLAVALTRQWPDSVASWFYAGLALHGLDPSRAAAYYAEGHRMSPENRGIAVNLGTVLYETGDYEGARRAYRSVLTRFPDDSLVLVNLANALEKSGQVDEAIREYRRALDADAELAEAWVGLAMAFERQGDPTRALEAWEKAAAIPSENPAVLQSLATGLIEAGRSSAALDMLRAAVERLPRDAVVRRTLGIALTETGQHEPAIGVLEQALALDPDDRRASVALASAHRGVGRTRVGVRILQDLVRTAPEWLDGWVNLGGMLVEVNDFDAAERALRRALEIDARSSLAWSNLGRVLDAKGQPDDAAAAWHRAVEADPGDATSLYHLGMLAGRRDEHREAVGHYERALAADAGFTLAWYNLGVSSNALGDIGRAAEAFRRALSQRPDDAVTKLALGQAYWNIGLLERGLALMREADAAGRGHADWPENASAFIEQCGTEIAPVLARVPRLVAAAAQSAPPDTPEELHELALAALATGRAHVAAGWYRDHWQRDRSRLLDDADRRHVQVALRCAVAAGFGWTDEPDASDAAARRRWLTLARRWLRDALDHWDAGIADGRLSEERVESRSRTLLRDRLLASVRLPRALARLPESERQAWSALWKELEEL